jgi:2-C-methyl-D-erythritol 4-phosphate cytidylyltransferase
MPDTAPPAPAERLRLHQLATLDARAAFAADVRRGLRSQPKQLPPKYFYDELGSLLFDAICLLPEYYLTRAEDEILTRHAAEIVAAAGRGDRLGLDRPKAFAQLRGRPLLAESLERLDGSGWVDAIVVAAPPGWEEPAVLLAEELGCGKVTSSVTGGSTRAESVRLALAEVPEEAVAVLVHDAARPLVTDEVVGRVLEPLGEGWDGAVPGLPVADTVKRVRGEEVVETVPRDDLVAVQTPQAFAVSVLRSAAAGDLAGASDCASLVERAGGRVKVVPGDPRLLKVTDTADLDLVASWL